LQNHYHRLSSLKTREKTEFELLLTGEDFSGFNSDTYDLSKILDQKLASAINGEINSIMGKNSNLQAIPVLQNLCSKIPSTIFTKYERAGKNYVTIEHKLGDSGNVFFSELFTRSICASDHHTVSGQNKICFIFRQ
jgi:hypothetical protein